MATEILAVDIGGSKIAVGLVSRKGQVRDMRAVPTPKTEDAGALFDCIVGLVSPLTSGAVACGVGCPGPMELDSGRVSPMAISAWRSFPLLDSLQDLTGLPTFVDNDAKALALGEAWLGSAVGVSNFLAMVVSTGVGGGLFLNGRLHDGDSGNAGHIGHVIVEPDGRLCSCGAKGCLTAECSGASIEEFTGRPAAEATVDVQSRTGRLVGRACASVANLLDLGLILVGGSVALGFGERFYESARQEVQRSAQLDFSRGLTVDRPGLGSAGPLVGAAAVARRQLSVPF